MALEIGRLAVWRYFRRAHDPHKDEVAIHDYPPFIFTLPLILVSYFLFFTGLHGVFWGWLWVLLIAVTFVMCTIEVGRNATIIAAIVVMLVPLLSYFLGHSLDITFIGDAWHWFIHLAPQAPGKVALILALLLSLIYVIMWADVLLNHRYVFSHNGLLHTQWGKSDVDMRWAQFRITFAMPNIPAFLLMGAGTVRVDSNVQNVGNLPPSYVIKHVPLLSWGKRARIERILAAIQVTNAGDVLVSGATPATSVAHVL